MSRVVLLLLVRLVCWGGKRRVSSPGFAPRGPRLATPGCQRGMDRARRHPKRIGEHTESPPGGPWWPIVGVLLCSPPPSVVSPVGYLGTSTASAASTSSVVFRVAWSRCQPRHVGTSTASTTNRSYAVLRVASSLCRLQGSTMASPVVRTSHGGFPACHSRARGYNRQQPLCRHRRT